MLLLITFFFLVLEAIDRDDGDGDGDDENSDENSALLSTINQSALESYDSLGSSSSSSNSNNSSANNSDTENGRVDSLSSLDSISVEWPRFRGAAPASTSASSCLVARPPAKRQTFDRCTSLIQRDNFKHNLHLLYLEIARANGSMVAAGNDGTSTDQLRVSLSNLDAITVTTVSTGEAEENGAESQPDCAFSESKTEVQRERVVATLATVPSELDDKSKHVITCLVPKLRVFFSIKAKYEFGHLSELFFGRLLMRFFFTSIIVYLLGDLLIYNTMMSKSLRVITW